MAKLMYALPTDNLSPVSTGGVAWALSTTGTIDAEYPAANLGDLNPARPAKFTGTTGSWVRDLGSAKQVDWVAIVMHNLSAGLGGVRIQGHTANAWGAPTLNQLITIPTYHEDGFPVNPFIDLTGIGSRTFRFWRLVFENANAAAIAVGEMWLVQTKRSMVHNIHWGLQEADVHNVVEHRTPYGVVSLFDLATKQRTLEGETMTSDAGLATLQTWHRACGGRARPTLVVLDPAVNDVQMSRWGGAQLRVVREFKDSNVVRLSFEELSRGLVL